MEDLKASFKGDWDSTGHGVVRVQGFGSQRMDTLFEALYSLVVNASFIFLAERHMLLCLRHPNLTLFETSGC